MHLYAVRLQSVKEALEDAAIAPFIVTVASRFRPLLLPDLSCGGHGSIDDGSCNSCRTKIISVGSVNFADMWK